MDIISEEKLILLVQEYKHLYDPSDLNYYNNLMKDNSWEEIGQILKTTGEACKNKWKSLRESYRKAMNSRKTKSGESAKKIKPWRLESRMEFVKSCLFSYSEEDFPNVVKSPESFVSNDIHLITHESIEIEGNERDVMNNQSKDSGRDSSVSERSIKTSVSNTKEIKNKNKPSSSIGRKNNLPENGIKSVPSGTAAEMLQHYMNMKLSATSNPQSSGDQLTKYFQSIEETVRTLPAYIQIRLKSQISQLVHNAELEAITTQIPTNHTSLFLSTQQQPQLYSPTSNYQLPSNQLNMLNTQTSNTSYCSDTLILPLQPQSQTLSLSPSQPNST